MTTISATSILASRHAVTGDRLDTLLLRYPRCIHSEFMTHRMFSRNAASSRAIPVEKLIQDVIDDPFVPLVWGKNQKGMQAGEECDATVVLRRTERHISHHHRRDAWLFARDNAVDLARAFNNSGYHKQIVNRLLEPFSHITVVCSSTNWSNFLALRDHPDAEPHIQMLAREIRKALDGAVVQELQQGEWHLPFVTDEDWRCFPQDLVVGGDGYSYDEAIDSLMKLSAARCASTSYRTTDGFGMTLERATALYDKLLSSPMHASPFEHQAMVTEPGQGNGGNFGPNWTQYRKTFAHECA